MKNITLVILAAGMGSRFGGLKQVMSIGDNDEVLADYSVYDAAKAGFTKVVYVIKPEMKQEFIQKVVKRIEKSGKIKVELAYQKMDDLPKGFSVPAGREKPWGTSHALWAARTATKEPFMVINADDFYGYSAYKDMYTFLSEHSSKHRYAMAGYALKNTILGNAEVSRGVCIEDGGYLSDIEEITNIHKDKSIFGYYKNQNFIELHPDTIVSMNAFGFATSIFDEICYGFENFLAQNINNLKAEYYLPTTVKEVINKNIAKIAILPAKDKWYGFTYKEDQEIVQDAIKKMISFGIYPKRLF